MSSERMDRLLSITLAVATSIVWGIAIRYVINQINPQKAPKPCPPFLKKYLDANNLELDEHEEVIASEVADPQTLNVSWEDIGGLDDTIEALKEVVVLPFVRTDIFNGDSKLLQPPRGILLHGRPGCGKTMLAKAIAKESSCFFINLRVSTIMEKWYGESQKLVNAVFTLAYKLQPCIVFIDEIDSFLRERASSDHEATAMMKAQFMSLWDGLASDSHCQVLILGATNRPQDVDSAIRRRMPRVFHVGLPERAQRESIIRVLLYDELVDPELDYQLLSKLMSDKSGSDIKEICRLAAMCTIREYLQKEKNETERACNSGKEKQKIERRPMGLIDFQKAEEQFNAATITANTKF